MFIDYIALMLINTVAALAVSAGFFWRGINSPNPKPWAAALAMPGLVSLVTGLCMVTTWPVGRPWLEGQQGMTKLAFANDAFGEPSVLLGIALLGAALCVARGWSLTPMSIYAALAGLAAITVGAAVAYWSYYAPPDSATAPPHPAVTAMPPLTTAGFVLAGLGAVLVPAAVSVKLRPVRYLTAILFAASALVWAATGYPAIWAHLGMWSK
ncbi:MAG: DUF981 family protein [Phycisphaerae bacterium]